MKISAMAYLRQTMEALGLEPKRSLGQNFLISDRIIEKIILAVKGTNSASVIEVGPGLGALTRFLKAEPFHFQVIELDRKLCEYWRNLGLEVTEADALQIDWSQFNMQRPASLVSNLPYQISSSLVIDRCLDQEQMDHMVLMFQKEVAQRIRAQQKDESYGMLSVVAQTFWEIETLADASSQDFYPAPKVASRVLFFHRRKETPIEDRRRYLKFIKGAFLHPRKLMSSNLQEATGTPKEKILEIFKNQKLDEKIRPAQLKVSQFWSLYKSFYSAN